MFRYSVTAVAGDIDELDHVSNQVYVRWVMEAALAHSAALGWGYPQYRESGAVFIVRRHEIDYLIPIVAGDRIACDTWVDSWRQASCIRKTTLSRGDEVVARAATTWAYVGWRDGRPLRIPDDLRALFGAAPAP
jgi:acyl-CoA thioester hydrolase